MQYWPVDEGFKEVQQVQSTCTIHASASYQAYSATACIVCKGALHAISVTAKDGQSKEFRPADRMSSGKLYQFIALQDLKTTLQRVKAANACLRCTFWTYTINNCQIQESLQ